MNVWNQPYYPERLVMKPVGWHHIFKPPPPQSITFLMRRAKMWNETVLQKSWCPSCLRSLGGEAAQQELQDRFAASVHGYRRETLHVSQAIRHLIKNPIYNKENVNKLDERPWGCFCDLLCIRSVPAEENLSSAAERMTTAPSMISWWESQVMARVDEAQILSSTVAPAFL